MDAGNLNAINLKDFRRVMSDYRLGLTEPECNEMFQAFDVDNSGKIAYEEFITIIRGKLSEERKNCILLAFERLDPHKQGFCDMAALKELYNPSNHILVKAGKKSEDDELLDFLETFDIHHKILWKGDPMGTDIGYDEFEEYYAFISPTIEDDAEFEELMRGVWGLGGKINSGIL